MNIVIHKLGAAERHHQIFSLDTGAFYIFLRPKQAT